MWCNMLNDAKMPPCQLKEPSANLLRREILDRFVQGLSSYEWRYLKDQLNARTFQQDPMAVLPLEIICNIVPHVSPTDVVRLRRVSRLWRTMLRSDVICAAVLETQLAGEWETPSQKRRQNHARVYSLAQRRHAFAHGRPHSVIKVDTTVDLSGHSHLEQTEYRPRQLRCAAYCQGNLTWIRKSKQNDSSLMVFFLLTGKSHEIRPRQRERLLWATISESLAAAVSIMGICYVYDLEKCEQHSFRLPSISLSSFTSKGTLVAAALREKPHTVIIWDLKTGRARSFDGLDAFYTIVLDPQKETLFTFDIQCLDTERATLKSREMNFKGEKLNSKEFSLDIWLDEVTNGDISNLGQANYARGAYSSFGAVPYDANGRYVLHRLVKADLIDFTRVEYIAVFDTKSHSLEINEPLPVRKILERDFIPDIKHDHCWNDVVYYLGCAHSPLPLSFVRDLHEPFTYSVSRRSFLQTPNFSFDSRRRFFSFLDEGGEELDDQLHGDDEDDDYSDDVLSSADGAFMVEANSEEFTIWCFDEDFAKYEVT
ncbi:hypothetical protein L228DRAFT_260924 [Xylona heveae TC161]|uniref:F-box domain-containing protein n=1 Tax=Xylona heveae (strain CBS 132557 / TC161) TaxID=1328760 RepID=A0A165GZD4_XYLHT|nr:hypothetical protein L228DRAFT_260924 [Xylona heveae TC161]KZF22790.1 hypothetical protein L228DRAFT_260924 [Xylona heveae TC161]